MKPITSAASDRRTPLFIIALFGLVLSRAALLCAADHFLTIGGGSSAANNQVSLEKNVLYLQRFLADRGLGDVPHEILFSDGAGGARDLQYIPAAKPPRVNELLAELFHQERGVDEQYRAHAIAHLWGASGRQSIGRWFDTVGVKLHEGDRLFIYYTGHGSRGKGGHNTALAMWREADMPVSEFARLLDRLPPKVSVVLVMVQCFGGGFADVIFNDADVSKGLSPRNRCGFFATTPDRVAAGCTPDVDEENYREYSTYFWAALYGRTRGGDVVPPPDYDGDGRISLAEAHAYAMVASDTIDLSMKTSDVFLRRFSKAKTIAGPAELIDADSGFQTLLDRAEPPERATLDGLSKRLDLDGFNRTQAARTIAAGIAERRRALGDEQRRLRQSHDRACNALAAMVRTRWPELTNLLNPAAVKLLAEQGDTIVRAIEAAPVYPELRRQHDRLDAIDVEDSDLERKWVKCQRFIRTAEHVALAANLALVAPPDVRSRYETLRTAEGGTLADPSH
ncbi:MAG TPA: hypothetical protein VGI81_09400 [Tepidisphaeraceae bacterium]